MKKNTARLGSISSGTMNSQDLIPTFCSELRRLGMRSRELSKIEKRFEHAKSGKWEDKNNMYFSNEESDYDLETLFDMLNEYAPVYCYFGAHPGDGADYGFWVNEDFAYNNLDDGEYDGLRVSDLSEIPARYTGEVLHVNDHGNMTLYNCKRGKLSEVWSVV